MIRASRFPHLIAILVALLAWSPGSWLEAQGRSSQSDPRGRIKQKVASFRSQNGVVVKSRGFGPARVEGEVSVREGAMTLSLSGQPSRTIRIKIREKVKKDVGSTDQSITAVDESTGQESVWSLVDEAGTVTMALNGAEKFKATANPDGTFSVNGAVYADETAAGNAAGQLLAATDLVPESAQAVAETIDTLLDESPASRGGGAVVLGFVLVLGLGISISAAIKGRLIPR